MTLRSHAVRNQPSNIPENCNESPMSSHAHGSPWWSAEKDFALLMLLTGGNRKAAQRLWLRKVRIHREAPPDAGASAPKAARQDPA